LETVIVLGDELLPAAPFAGGLAEPAPPQRPPERFEQRPNFERPHAPPPTTQAPPQPKPDEKPKPEDKHDDKRPN